MAIIYNQEQHTITLHTQNTSYQMLIGQYDFLLHLYYGRKIQGSMEHLLTYYDRGFSGNPYDACNQRTFSLDALPQEYSVRGNGDYRTTSLTVKNEDGSYSCDLRYKGHEIVSGKYNLSGLPAMYATEKEAETLKVFLYDEVTKVEVTLLYGVLEALDIITRSVEVTNGGEHPISLEKVHSACLDFMNGSYDLLHFHGRHGHERMLERTEVMHGIQSIGSKRGTSSHQHNPFFILAEKDTTEESGSCYGMSLMYSGGFQGEVEGDQYGQTRVTLGIQEELFSYHLDTNESFLAPEVIMTYSSQGLETLSHNYHEALRHHVCRGKYKEIRRPVLINNWEATYFDFNGEKIFQIAKQASELGVEMLVLDDGWFGKRDSDNSGLGDWFVNEEKMNGTLGSVVEKVNSLGMKFGLWIEPEMVSEDSELYRAHPDWAFTIPGRKPIRSRNQLVLDFSRPEVVDGIFNQIAKVLDQANVEYIKMDMNRSITDVYSAVTKHGNQGEVLHRYVLGMYDFMERLLERYPNIFIEGCSGGGGRFDAGMLYYTPQIWCSDNTDAIERISIQHGTSFGYPISSVGSHVSAVPNHQTGRTTSMKMRGVVAMAGSFGYELDLNKISNEEKDMVKAQIKAFHQYWELIHNGRYYRITNPMKEREFGAWQFVSKDKKEALMNVVTLDTHCNKSVSYVKFKGLLEDALYQVEDKVMYGSSLMHGGVPIPLMTDEYQSWQLHVKVVSE